MEQLVGIIATGIDIGNRQLVRGSDAVSADDVPLRPDTFEIVSSGGQIGCGQGNIRSVDKDEIALHPK
ncbi:MAG TPA: hypothetical protein PLZ76_05860 [Bacillota bacterium]|nr:hypothetical protein [Bacillota bacterium]